MFSGTDLRRLIVPLVIEQVLAVTVGMADVIMVSSVGEAAVSGVSLVDMVNVLIINVFAALATGGAVVSAQLIGAKERERACHSAKQLLLIVSVISAVVMALCLLFRTPLLRLLFGQIDPDVMRNARVYFLLSALSYPFLAVYNASAALFRAQGNSRISMQVSIVINVLNIGGNALFIYGMAMGAAGAALSSLISRALGAVIMTALLRRPGNLVSIGRGGSFRPDGAMIGRILNIGIPNGLENSMFQLGKILVVGIIAAFGTTQIAANAVANNFDALGCLPGQALSLAIITVVGQCVGAQDYEQARYYAKKLMKLAYLIMAALNIVILASLPLTLRAYNLSPDTMKLAMILIFIHDGSAILLWPAAFTLPNVLRAANDVRFAMAVSIFSMWVFRCVFGFILGSWLGWGAIGVWVAMIMDWIFRASLFVWRYLSGRWTRHKIA
ncbi:MATE family efflux transporter [Intestinibacillus massiliensis]|uniref:MATE family efflux transporter n=1 Tax=Intestinibacillus massiliensis TaxID=1871029 RepID=UPI000B34ECBD|nr:MATE family efflux transporter [Intestinibacillus massiliensis]